MVGCPRVKRSQEQNTKEVVTKCSRKKKTLYKVISEAEEKKTRHFSFKTGGDLLRNEVMRAPVFLVCLGLCVCVAVISIG